MDPSLNIYFERPIEVICTWMERHQSVLFFDVVLYTISHIVFGPVIFIIFLICIAWEHLSAVLGLVFAWNLPVSFILTPQERGDETHGSDFVKTHSLKGGGRKFWLQEFFLARAFCYICNIKLRHTPASCTLRGILYGIDLNNFLREGALPF